MNRLLPRIRIGVICSMLLGLLAEGTGRADIARNITFPVIGQVTFSNDFGAPRVGHTHEGNDIFGAKMSPLIAASDGVVSFISYPQPSWGWAVFIDDVDGYEFRYIHLNNDTPGTDDGAGGAANAYAPDIVAGNRVVAGQLIGFMGDSGNAENTRAHLHFEIRAPDGTPLSPYEALVYAPRLTAPSDYPALTNEFLPYRGFRGGTSIAAGNLDGDLETEVVTGAGPGGGPHVRIFDVTGTSQGNGFFAYDAGFRGGVDVASGDVDGDGVDEVITGAGRGGGPHVRVFDAEGVLISGFFAYDVGFRGGVHVDAGDLDGDGIAEIVTGAGPGGGPHVRIFNVTGTAQGNGFFPYDPGFNGGVDVAVGDVTGTATAEIVTGAGPGGGPHVRIFKPDGELITNGFFPYSVNFQGGVRVAVGNVRTRSRLEEIVTAPASNGGPHIRLLEWSGTEISSRFPFDYWFIAGGYDVAAARGRTFASTTVGGRRASVRAGPR